MVLIYSWFSFDGPRGLQAQWLLILDIALKCKTELGVEAMHCHAGYPQSSIKRRMHANTHKHVHTHTHTHSLTLLLLLPLYHCRFAAVFHRPINHLRPLFWLFSSLAAGPAIWNQSFKKCCLRSRKCDKWHCYNTPVSVASRLFILREMSKHNSEALCPAIKPYMSISMQLERAGY